MFSQSRQEKGYTRSVGEFINRNNKKNISYNVGEPPMTYMPQKNNIFSF